MTLTVIVVAIIKRGRMVEGRSPAAFRNHLAMLEIRQVWGQTPPGFWF